MVRGTGKSRETKAEARMVTQVREDGGLNQAGSNRDGETCKDSEYSRSDGRWTGWGDMREKGERDDSGRLGLSNQNGSAFPCDGDDHVEQSVRGLAVI